jgi:hypothetical protein
LANPFPSLPVLFARKNRDEVRVKLPKNREMSVYDKALAKAREALKKRIAFRK